MLALLLAKERIVRVVRLADSAVLADHVGNAGIDEQAGAVGAQPDAVLGGRSRVVDPTGEVLAEAGDTEQLLWCELDPSRVELVRRSFPVLADSRA